MIEQLQELLVQTGRLSAKDAAKAESHLSQHGGTFSEALVSLALIDTTDLRSFQAELLGLPFRAQLPELIPQDTVDMVSARCARRWKAFPIEYAEGQRRLTLAVSEPERIPFIEGIFEFLMQPYELAFVVAVDSLIEKAIAERFTEDPPAPADDEDDGKKLRSLNIKPSRPRPAGTAPFNGRQAQRGRRRKDDVDYETMARALVSAVALSTRMHLADDVERLSTTLERVRYSQLLGARLKLKPTQRDGLVVAAWASALWPQRDLVRQLDTPYEIEEIVFSDEDHSGRRRVETSILSLVSAYQELYKLHPDMCHDVNLTRRELRVRWKASNEHESILETFLQILVDEEFLSSLDETARRILIVDPDEAPFGHVSQALSQSGYEVVAISDPAEAESVFNDLQPNVVMVSMDLPHDGGLSFCRRVRRLDENGSLTLMALISPSDNRMAAACLREGADDFLTRPVDAELLFLKLRSRLGEDESDASPHAGVSGQLTDMSFNDMIQIFSAGRRSIQISLRNEASSGEVWMRDGQIVHAAGGDTVGEAAFYEMMAWSDGSFETTQSSTFPESTIEVSTMSLLMEGSRLADEGPED